MRLMFIATLLCLLVFSSKSNAQLDAALILGKRASELENPLAFGPFLRLGFAVSEADEVSAEVSLLAWDDSETAYLAGKLGYLYTLNREGYGWFVEPLLGFAVLPSYSEYDEGTAKGGVGTINFGYRFGQQKFRADLALRYEHVIASQVGHVSSIGLRFAVAIGFGRGRFQN